MVNDKLNIKKESKWYSLKRVFSYNALINFVMSHRGGGKSFGAKQQIIENWLKDGSESVYIRRSKTELEEVKETYWADIRGFYPQLELTVKGFIGYINDIPVVYFIPLSTSSKKKSASYPNVTFIVFDEYVITTTTHSRYLKNEGILLNDLLETIIRQRDNVKVLILSNNISYVNPFFTFWDIEVNEEKRFNVFHGGLIVVELYTNEIFAEEKRKTKLGRLFSGTKYGDYAIDGKVLEDNEEFIRSRPNRNMYFVSAFKYEQYELGVWLDEMLGVYFIDYKVDNTSKNKYYLRNEDIIPTYVHVKTDRASWRIKKVTQAFQTGKLYFLNQEIKKLYINHISKYI